MILMSSRLATAFLCACFCAGALAVEAPLNLCTGGPEGNYFAVGNEMAAHANPKYLHITVVETQGSMDNLQRLARRECGAAIVQSDAFLVFEARNPNNPIEITRNRFLYAEYAHLVCRRDARIASIDELVGNPQRHKVLVGTAQSGSALTWQAFTRLDDRFGQLPVGNVGGLEALGQVLGREAQCMFFVAGLGSELGDTVNKRGKDLRLVPITEDVLRTAEFGSVTLYESRNIPKGYYENLESGDQSSGVETLTVGATLIIDRQWSDRYPNGPSALLGAVTGATPAIDKRAMSGLR